MNDYDELISALIEDGLMDPETGEIFNIERVREVTNADRI